MKLTPSGSQTVGPFFSIGLAHLYRRDEDAGCATVRGRVLDGDGAPVTDALLEIWESRLENGVRSDRFARAATDDLGEFCFSIRRPLPGDGDPEQAPHIKVLVFARGLLRHLMTRMYLPGEDANETDPVLRLVPETRRPTLIARNAAHGSDVLEWDVVLQGTEETVFFAW